MKKYIYTLALVVISFGLSAQNHVDALRYSQHTIGGTARSVGMAGAFGSLGGDFSTLSQNPAGLGIYRKSEFTFSPEFYLKTIGSRYEGNEEFDSKFNVNLSNLGYVACFREDNGILKAINLGIGFNRIANFHNNTLIKGVNENTSFADNMANAATLNGLDAFSSDLFYQGYLIDEIDGDNPYFDLNEIYFGDNGFLYPEQTYSKEESGRINEWVFSLGLDFSDIFYFGGTLGIQSVNYDMESNFMERDAADLNYQYFNYFESLTVNGTGFSGKLGLIVRPIPIIRIGAAIHLPIVYHLRETYETNLQSEVGSFYPTENGYRIDLENNYRVVTPAKFIGSASLILGKFLILSGDFEYLNYSSMSLKPSLSDEYDYVDNYNFTYENEDIQTVYSDAVNLKIGTELRLGSLYFRGGLGLYGSPFAPDEINSKAHQYSSSLGFGIRDKDFFFDIAYQYTFSDENYYLYTAQVPDGDYFESISNLDNKTHRIVTTIGFKF